MKKYFLFLIFSLMPLVLFASPKNYPAMVIVLEAPLLAAPDWRAPVLQNKRKGDRIHIMAGQLERADYQQGLAERSYWRKQDASRSEFWETLDRNGTTAYVPKKYVKIIYADERELLTSVAPFEKDPSDYRLSEPIPENYPFYDGDRRRAVLNIIYGPSQKANYAYSLNYESEEFQAHRGMQFMYLKKVSFDPLERFFFGGVFQISADQTLISFDNDNRAREERALIGAGPFLSYDVYRDHKNTFTIGGGLNLQWNRQLILAFSRDGNREERMFNGLSVRPKLQGYYQRREIFPNINLVVGLEMEGNLPYRLNPQSQAQLPEYWNANNDTVDVPLDFHFSALLGLMATY